MMRHGGQGQVGLHPGLMTDLYHPDSAYVSWRAGLNGLTTFDLYTRSAPFRSSFILTAGLEMALDFVRAFRYTDEDLRFLSQIRDFEPAFLDELAGMRFTGEILAMPEGTIAFPHEPIMRVTAPFREALLLESGLLSAINLSTLLATKAARVVHAAQGRPVAEFALRRAQEPFTVTRSSYIGGCTSTSFLAAAYEFRLRATGTIPHALVQLFESERQAFTAVAATYNRYTLLLDTYDVHAAIHTAIAVAREARAELGHVLAAVRLDSGDLVADSRYVRGALDDAGLTEVRILASGDLDEFRIVDLLEAGAPIDGFGVGTSLGVGAGSTERDIAGGALGGVYKAVWYVDERGESRPLVKAADEAKATWPGRKELYRRKGFGGDIIQLSAEAPPPRSERVLRPVVVNGRVLPGSTPPLSEVWEHAQTNLQALPEAYKALHGAPAYPVEFSPALRSLRAEAARHGGRGAPHIAPSNAEPAPTRDDTSEIPANEART
jgi:nicotinate phosphoribosyltransferase